MKIEKILPVFSYLFHPIFVTLYGVLLYFYITEGYFFDAQIYLTVIQVTILTILLPLSLYFLFISLGFIKSFTEANLKERRLPIAIQAILLFILLKFSSNLNEIPELYFFILGGFTSSVIALLLTLMRFKVSLHLIAVASLTTFVYAIGVYQSISLLFIISMLIVLTGIVASSRLYMKSHSNIELFIGTLVGVGCQVIYWGFL